MEKRQCIGCSCILNDDNWSPSNQKYRIYKCKSCISLESKEYQDRTQYNINKARELKLEVIENYDGKCACCGIDIFEFLTIDHKNNDGAKHRQELGATGGGGRIYKWLQKEGYPKDNFQLLCMNCNGCKGHNGFCLHTVRTYDPFCCFCGEILNEKSCFKVNLKYGYSICRVCMINRSIQKNPNTQLSRRINKKSNSLAIKNKIIENYGGVCDCCGASDIYILTIDHSKSGGRKEQKELEAKGKSFYQWLINNNYPQDNYQLLCYNCNCSKGFYGYCPHQKPEENLIIIPSSA